MEQLKYLIFRRLWGYCDSPESLCLEGGLNTSSKIKWSDSLKFRVVRDKKCLQETKERLL